MPSQALGSGSPVATACALSDDRSFEVIEDFRKWLKPEVAIPVAAFKALTSVIKRSEASTMMELEVQLRAAADSLKNCRHDMATGLNLNGKTSISLTAGCELFLRYVTRCFLDFPVMMTSTLPSDSAVDCRILRNVRHS